MTQQVHCGICVVCRVGRALRNEHSGDADYQGDLAVQNARLTQALQQARDRIRKMEDEAKRKGDNTAERMAAVREAEDRVSKLSLIHI